MQEQKKPTHSGWRISRDFRKIYLATWYETDKIEYTVKFDKVTASFIKSNVKKLMIEILEKQNPDSFVKNLSFNKLEEMIWENIYEKNTGFDVSEYIILKVLRFLNLNTPASNEIINFLNELTRSHYENRI